MAPRKKSASKKKRGINLGKVTSELDRVKKQLQTHRKKLDDIEKKAIDLKIEGIKRLYKLLEEFCMRHRGGLGGPLDKFGFRPPFFSARRKKPTR
jgi:hypothetical protein